LLLSLGAVAWAVSAVDARSECRCTADCKNCTGCADHYETPLIACGACYAASRGNEGLVCRFTGELAAQDAAKREAVGRFDHPVSDFSKRLPGTRPDSHIRDDL
jgi:hypothetical protein